MTLIIYEEKPEDWYPLTNLIGQPAVRVGMMTIAGHAARIFRSRTIDWIGRPSFGPSPVQLRPPVVYVSSRWLGAGRLAIPEHDARLEADRGCAGFVKTTPPFPLTLEAIGCVAGQLRRVEPAPGIVIDHPWDLIAHHGQVFERQFRARRGKKSAACRADVLGDRKDLFVDRRARVHKQVFIDLRGGPVYVDAGAEIMPFTSIIGPSYIGPHTVVDRAKVTGSSIGPQCRIAGEVESCIFQGYANKHHEGFIGHSYVGEWVNLGALTTNSDLKNNYGPVRVNLAGREVDTGMTKLGCFIGDHAKLGIGTLIPTGAVIGSFVNFAAAGLMEKYTPDFTWIAPGRRARHDLEKALATARQVMRRRNVAMSDEYERTIRALYGRIRGRD